MEQAYDDPNLKSLVRDFDCRDDALVLTDTYEFGVAPATVVERFVSLLPIEIGEGKLICGDSVMEFSQDLYTAELYTEVVSRSGGKKDTVYIVDLTAKATAEKMVLTFTFK